ncbi:COG1470 family protein [Cellulosimicrobium cellulans]|uniref:COG1470 family protein n=1 Tax=Cellulosimicrobium cellulans TaxID=1710 RepID=UPI00084859F3|nr:hypothetical protein [Cellulosimicrobium cellulans]
MTSQHLAALRRAAVATGLVGGLLATAVPASAATTSPAALATAPVVVGSPLAETAGDDAAARTTWAIEPATADGPDGRVSLRHVVDPGGEVTDHVALRNFSDRAVTFDVYASDGIVTADGLFDLLPAGTEAVDAGSWIAIGDATGALGEPGQPRQVEVGPQATVTLPVAVRVPAEATPGDHPAGIVASLSREDASGVQMETRVGARLHLRVAGDVEPALAVTDVRTTWTPSWNPFAPGELRVDYVVENTGNVRLGADVAATGSGPFGWAGHEGAGTAQREVLPRQEAAGVVVVDAWPLGRLTGDVTATPLVVGDDEVSARLVQTGASYALWAVPWLHLAILALVVGGVLGVRQLRRRREARTQARIDAAVAAARDAAPA